MKSKSADITCGQTLIETDKVMRAPGFLGKSRIKKYFYVLSEILDERKLKIIFSLIAQESLCVCDIVYILGYSIVTAPHRLRMSYDVDILDHQKKGKVMYYFIKSDDLKRVLAQLDR